MKPRTDRQKMFDKLDAAWRQLVKERDFHRCQLCYRQGNEAHHIFSRKNLSTRWDMENGITLCPECHRWVHDFPEEAATTFMNNMRLKYIALQKKSKVILHLKNCDLEDLLKALKNG